MCRDTPKTEGRHEHTPDRGTSASETRALPFSHDSIKYANLIPVFNVGGEYPPPVGGWEQVSTYLSCTCEWGVSSADLCVSGCGELCVGPAQTW